MRTTQTTGPTHPEGRSEGVQVSSTVRTDVFTGAPAALIAAGIVTAAQVAPQAGREGRKALFLPSGEPCPPDVRGRWREPGYRTVFHTIQGTCIVEVTVSWQEQQARKIANRQRQYASRETEKKAELAAAYRESRIAQVELGIDFIWRALCGSNGVHTLAVGPDTAEWEALGEAFAAMREVACGAALLTNGESAPQPAERHSPGQVQNNERRASHLRLVVDNSH